MDTKQLEQIGETYIVSKLLDADILVAKPFFDRLGTDLIGFTSVNDKAKFCRIQCKYRKLKTTTFVKVDALYVAGAFILFLYIKDSNDKRHFYCFLPDDINRIFVKKNKQGKELFQLNITKSIVQRLDNDLSISFTHKKVESISNLMNKYSTDDEFRRIVKDILHNYNELTELQQKQIALKQLAHDFEVNKLKRESLKEKISVLKEYKGLTEKYYEEQQQKNGENI